MKNIRKLLLYLLFWGCILPAQSQTGAIRINQLGYYPESNKMAIVVFPGAASFEVVDVADGEVVFSGNLSAPVYWRDAGDTLRRADFSSLTQAGTYKVRIPGFGESHPFEISETVLRRAAYASLKSFYYQRCSYVLTASYAGLWARPAGHPDNACRLHSSTGRSGTMASPGGWYDAGDYGKYVINAGISVASLLSFHENFSTFFQDGTLQIPESGNGKNELLDEVKFELDWLKTMQDSDSGVFFKVTTLGFSGFIMPDKDVATRYVIGKSTSSALDFAAMMAMAGRIYRDYDSSYAADCVVRAENAWAWAVAHPAVYFTNPSDVSTGEYGDNNVSDEFIWAAAELYITTGKETYKTYLEGKSSLLRYQDAPGWQGVRPLAALSLATRPNGLDASLQATLRGSITSKADSWLSQIASNPCRIPTFGYYWGSNSVIANQGIGLLYAYLLTQNVKYIKGAAECADYLLGKNATGFSFVSGYGSLTPMNFHHRPSHADGIPQPIPGFVAGGPNSGKQDGEKYPFNEAAKCYVDVMGSYASNEVCINWNSPMTALFAGIDAVLGNDSIMRLEVAASVNNPPSLSLSSPVYDQKTGSDVPLQVKGTTSDPDGVQKVEIYIDSRYRGETTISPFVFTVENLSFGTHTVTALAFDKKGLATGKTNAFQYYAVSTIPGRIEAEHYYNMSGISTQTTVDAGAGLNITGIDAADWMDFVVTAAQAGDYQVGYRVASANGGGKLELRKATAAVLGSMDIPKTGSSQIWITLSDTITLEAGKQTLRVQAVAGGWTLNWLEFSRVVPTSAPALQETGETLLRVMPGPSSGTLRIHYRLGEPSGLEFVLFDIRGSQLDRHASGNKAPRQGEFIWTPKCGLGPGIYLVAMLSDGYQAFTDKVLIHR